VAAEELRGIVGAVVVVDVEMLDADKPVKGNPFKDIIGLVAHDGTTTEEMTRMAAPDDERP
jgi:hypothetical protein